MIDASFIYLALGVNFLGIAYYVFKTMSGSVQPHPVTWMLWSVAPLMAFVVQVASGVGLSSLLTLAAGTSPAIIFAIIVARGGPSIWRVKPFDVACGVLSFAALLTWLVFHKSDLAVLLAIAADAVAAAPTIVKAWKEPKSESWVVYSLLGFAAVIATLSIQAPSLTASAFPLYLATLEIGLAVMILMRIAAVSGRTSTEELEAVKRTDETASSTVDGCDYRC